MSPRDNLRPLSLMAPPYRALRPVARGKHQIEGEGRRPGSALVWYMHAGQGEVERSLTEERPGGLSLIVILPPVAEMPAATEVASLVSRCRPCAILPHHDDPSVEELAHVLRKPPDDLPSELTDYLAWRGVRIDRDTRHLIRRIVELSADLRSVTALSRGLYMSRRALGRRLLSRGLPVPSHWLQVSRLLRVAIRLQTSDDSVLVVGYELGYPDGFSVSNQMLRLVGCRPNDARRCWGWEWMVESWLTREASQGGLAPEFAERFVDPVAEPREPARVAAPAPTGRRPHRTRRQSAS